MSNTSKSGSVITSDHSRISGDECFGNTLWNETEALPKVVSVGSSGLSANRCPLCGELAINDWYEFFPKEINKFCVQHAMDIVNFTKRACGTKRKVNGGWQWRRLPTENDIGEFIARRILILAKKIEDGSSAGICENITCLRPATRILKNVHLCGVCFNRFNRRRKWGY